MKAKYLFLISMLLMTALTVVGQITPPQYPYPDPLPASGDIPNLHSLKVTKALSTTAYEDERPVVWDDFIGGGMRSVGSTNERNAIVQGRRKEGMMVMVKSVSPDTNAFGLYMLLKGISNTNWYKIADITTTNGFNIPSLKSVNIFNSDGQLTTNRLLSGVGTYSLGLAGLTGFNTSADSSLIQANNQNVVGLNNLTLASLDQLDLLAPNISITSSNSFLSLDHNSTTVGAYGTNGLIILTPAVHATTATAGQVLTLIDTNGIADFATITGGTNVFNITYTTNYVNDNFANTDLTFTGNRTHDAAGNSLAIDNISTLQLFGSSLAQIRFPFIQVDLSGGGEGEGLSIANSPNISIDGDGMFNGGFFVGSGTPMYGITLASSGDVISLDVDTTQGIAFKNKQIHDGVATLGQVWTLTNVTTGKGVWANPPAGQNFANADLTATGDRYHDFTGYRLTINSPRGFSVNSIDDTLSIGSNYELDISTPDVNNTALVGQYLQLQTADAGAVEYQTIYFKGTATDSGGGAFVAATASIVPAYNDSSDPPEFMQFYMKPTSDAVADSQLQLGDSGSPHYITRKDGVTHLADGDFKAGATIMLTMVDSGAGAHWVCESCGGGGGQNIANANLTFDGSHTTDAAGYDFSLNNVANLSLGGSSSISASLGGGVQAQISSSAAQFLIVTNTIQMNTLTGDIYMVDQDVYGGSSTNGMVLTMIDQTTGKVGFRNASGGSSTNFANANLTATASRVHDWAGHNLTIENLLSFTMSDLTGSYIQVGPAIYLSNGAGTSFINMTDSETEIGGTSTNGIRLFSKGVNNATVSTNWVWTLLNAATGAGEWVAGRNMFDANGTLAGNRVVSGGGHSLTFQTALSDFNVLATNVISQASLNNTINGALIGMTASSSVTVNTPLFTINNSSADDFLFTSTPNDGTDADHTLERNPSTGEVRWNTGRFVFPRTGVPSVAAGTGAGTGPTVTLVRQSDSAFTLSVIPGSTPAVNATVATVTFASAYAAAPHWSLAAGNAATALLSGNSACYGQSTTTTFVLKSGPTALTQSTTYLFEVIIVK